MFHFHSSDTDHPSMLTITTPKLLFSLNGEELFLLLSFCDLWFFVGMVILVGKLFLNDKKKIQT